MEADGQIEATALRASLMRSVINCTSHSQVIKWKVTNMQNVLSITMETGKNMQWTLWSWSTLLQMITAYHCITHYVGVPRARSAVWRRRCDGFVAICWTFGTVSRPSDDVTVVPDAWSLRRLNAVSHARRVQQYYTSIYFSFRYSGSFR